MSQNATIAFNFLPDLNNKIQIVNTVFYNQFVSCYLLIMQPSHAVRDTYFWPLEKCTDFLTAD